MFFNIRRRGLYALVSITADCFRDAALPLIAIIMLGLFSTEGSAYTTYCVDGDKTSSGNGQNWANAFRYLREALNAAGSGDKIWVKSDDDTNGTVYYPDDGGSNNVRTETFALESSLAIYGGFEGDENDLNQRDHTMFISVLSANLQQNDAASLVNFGDNAYDVVTTTSDLNTAILDGFIIRAGNADGGGGGPTDGGGIYGLDTQAQVCNRTVGWCSARYKGGGVTIEQSSTTSAPTIRATAFNNNRANFSIDSLGGAVYCGEDIVIASSILWFNAAAVGPQTCHASGTLTITNANAQGGETAAEERGDVPQTVEECLEKYETTAGEIACIETLCRSGKIPPEECPD